MTAAKPSENVPVPDPTSLTTAALEREVKHLRELMDSRHSEMDKAVAQLEESILGRMEAADTLALARLDSVTKEFVTFRTLLDANAAQAALALTSADKAVSAAFASSKEAIAKAETFNEKRFDILTKQIDELKAAAQLISGRAAGYSALYGWAIAGIGIIITVVVFANATFGKG